MSSRLIVVNFNKLFAIEGEYSSGYLCCSKKHTLTPEPSIVVLGRRSPTINLPINSLLSNMKRDHICEYYQDLQQSVLSGWESPGICVLEDK